MQALMGLLKKLERIPTEYSRRINNSHLLQVQLCIEVSV